MKTASLKEKRIRGELAGWYVCEAGVNIGVIETPGRLKGNFRASRIDQFKRVEFLGYFATRELAIREIEDHSWLGA